MRSPVHSRCLAEYPTREDVSTGEVSQRWSPVAHYNARRSRRTYLRIMAIMLIIVSRAPRARTSGSVAVSPRSGNGVCHYYGDRLTVNARYSFSPYASGCPPSFCERDARGWQRRKEGRTNEPRNTRSGLTQRYAPSVFSGELPARGN